MSLRDATGADWLVSHVREALAEDLGDRGDITSMATIPAGSTGRAVLVAKQAGVICGIDWAMETARQVEPVAPWSFRVCDGDRVTAGEEIATVEGSLVSILIAERTALNGLGRLSGIATVAAQAMERVDGTRAVVIDTRKTTPGWRLAEKYAVRCGGAGNHRIGLYDEVLIKENHIEGSGGTAEAVHAAYRWMEDHLDRPAIVEIEVESLEQLDQALVAAPDRVLLDNFGVDSLREAVRRAGDRCVLEASGGITLDTLADVAATGVHRISLGALTHTLRPLDLSLRVTETSKTTTTS